LEVVTSTARRWSAASRPVESETASGGASSSESSVDLERGGIASWVVASTPNLFTDGS